MGRPIAQIVGRGVAAIYAALILAVLFFGLPFTGWRALSVQTGSMVPAIRPGALIVTHAVPATSLHLGDVVTYRSLKDPNTTITHRIIGFRQRGVFEDIIVQGDANPEPDPPVLASQIVGRMSLSIPWLGRAVDWIHTLPGILLLIYIPALGIIIYELQLLVRRMTDLEIRSLSPLKRPARIVRFKPTRLVYTVRSGAHGPRIIRRLGVLPIIFILPASMALVAHGTLARLQDQTPVAGNTITASRSHGVHDGNDDGEEDKGRENN